MPTELIADIALRATIGAGVSPVLSYKVPPRLRGLVRPGQLVWAPLRSRRVQGVVLALAPAEGAGLRELADVGDPEAALTEAGLALARWVAGTYRTHLYDALALLLPPGVGQEAETTWRVTPAGLAAELGALPERERAILYYLRSRGELGERELRRNLRGTDAELRAAYADLYERGLVARGSAVSAPAARPRIQRLARLLIPPAELPAAVEGLRRAPRQAAVLGWLGEGRRGGGEEERRGGGEGPQAAVPVSEIYAATGADSSVLRELERRGMIAFETREVRRDPLAGDSVPPDQPPPLTPEQRSAYEAIVAALEERTTLPHSPTPPLPRSSAQTFLLHGITGSGKTEVYLRTIARAMRLGRQALVLVPEIALTAQLVRRFAARFPGRIAVLHSGLSLGERYDEWRRLRRGEARLAIGSRSAVFAPLPELGLVIVDEEHELTFKHDGAPRYHARDAALRLAELSGAVTVLGSATPSVESYFAAASGRYRLLELRERVGGGVGPDGLPRSTPLPLPPVRLVDMRRELQGGNRSIFSRALQLALDAAVGRGEQAILFLNRRGAAAFVMCRDCGEVVKCGACSGPMTVHYDAEERRDGQGGNEPSSLSLPPSSLLICHSCGARAPVPYVCPQCMSTRMKAFGVGTQRVAEEVTALFPTARVLRWDRDSAGGKGAHDRMLDALLRREVDVLVGTQMIAKGLDLPLVSLVGVVAADTGLHLPDFRSGERAFQLLTQVAGRAGRRTAGAEVIIQTYNPEHYALRAAQEHDYHGFFTQEIAYRRETGYPPFSRLVRLVHAGGTEGGARREAEALHERLLAELERRRLESWGVVGPAPAFIQRARGRWRWHLILRVPAQTPARELDGLLDALGPLHGWVVDVDPAHVL
jgi:primosomal protein N' (replication factor Y)